MAERYRREGGHDPAPWGEERWADQEPEGHGRTSEARQPRQDSHSGSEPSGAGARGSSAYGSQGGGYGAQACGYGPPGTHDRPGSHDADPHASSAYGRQASGHGSGRGFGAGREHGPQADSSPDAYAARRERGGHSQQGGSQSGYGSHADGGYGQPPSRGGQAEWRPPRASNSYGRQAPGYRGEEGARGGHAQARTRDDYDYGGQGQHEPQPGHEAYANEGYDARSGGGYGSQGAPGGHAAPGFQPGGYGATGGDSGYGAAQPSYGGYGPEGGGYGGRASYAAPGGYGSQAMGAQGAFGSGGGQQQGHQSRPQTTQRRGPKGYKRSDERIREDLCERLIHAPYIDASGVSVEVKDGTVSLEGTVPERRMKHAIEDMAEACAGVNEIENRIRVARSSSPPHSAEPSGAPPQEGGAGKDASRMPLHTSGSSGGLTAGGSGSTSASDVHPDGDSAASRGEESAPAGASTSPRGTSRSR